MIFRKQKCMACVRLRNPKNLDFIIVRSYLFSRFCFLLWLLFSVSLFFIFCPFGLRFLGPKNENERRLDQDLNLFTQQQIVPHRDSLHNTEPSLSLPFDQGIKQHILSFMNINNFCHLFLEHRLVDLRV